MKSPFLSADGFDSMTQTTHCGLCEKPIFTENLPLEDHFLCDWKHYGIIEYPEVKARDELGKTIEDGIERPKRTILAQIPEQCHISFCKSCQPKLGKNGCAVCGKPVDTSTSYSKVQVLFKYKSGNNGQFGEYQIHHDCLPTIFDKVRSYNEKYKPKS